MERQSLQGLYVEHLRDLYSAEQQILTALPKLIEKASHPELRRALEEHRRVTEQHAQRLTDIFKQLGEKGSGTTCKGMQGIIAEGDELVRKFSDSDVLDAAIIAAAQRVEHYEIAAYGCARTYASTLGLGDQADALQKTLDEEGKADHTLTDLADEAVNVDAMKV
ncbi:MAG TPA: ferritin-like domain-containing protein [Gemmatimonadaceae bacterium]|nr:ferritin-like domain-containing protein [Gemmatimonadaceae bacterium]